MLFPIPAISTFIRTLVLLTIVTGFALSARAVSAATYYVDATGGSDSNDGLTTGTAWQTLDKVSSSTFAAGDIIDGLGSVFSGQYQAGGNIINRLVIPSSGSAGGGYITFRNFTVDGSISFDGLLSFNPTNTYSSTSPWSAYGAGDISGEIYKKTSTRAPYQLFEDGIKLTPIITTDAAGALALTRGQYTWNGITLYYRASDGAAPSTHTIRGSRRDIDGQLGLIYSSGKSYIKLENIVTKNHDPNTAGSWSIYISGGDHVLIDSVECTANNKGLKIDGVTDVVLSSMNIHNNISGGMLIEGSVSNFDFSGTVTTNGRYLHYDGANILYKNDGDGIGIDPL